MVESNGWPEYKKQILFQLQELNNIIKELAQKTEIDDKDLNKKIDLECREFHHRIDSVKDDLVKKIDSIKEEVITLKVKAAVIGGVAGFIVAIIGILVHWVK